MPQKFYVTLKLLRKKRKLQVPILLNVNHLRRNKYIKKLFLKQEKPFQAVLNCLTISFKAPGYGEPVS